MKIQLLTRQLLFYLIRYKNGEYIVKQVIKTHAMLMRQHNQNHLVQGRVEDPIYILNVVFCKNR